MKLINPVRNLQARCPEQAMPPRPQPIPTCPTQCSIWILVAEISLTRLQASPLHCILCHNVVVILLDEGAIFVIRSCIHTRLDAGGLYGSAKGEAMRELGQLQLETRGVNGSCHRNVKVSFPDFLNPL